MTPPVGLYRISPSIFDMSKLYKNVLDSREFEIGPLSRVCSGLCKGVSQVATDEGRNLPTAKGAGGDVESSRAQLVCTAIADLQNIT